MGESVEFKVKLDDEVSGPAKRSRTAIQKLAEQMAGLARSTRKANTYTERFGKGLRSGAIKKWTANVEKARRQTWKYAELNKKLIAQDAKLRGGMAGVGRAGGMGGAAAGMTDMMGRLAPLIAVAYAAARALQVLARGALIAGRAIAESALYMDGMRYSLAKFLGSAEASSREMRRLLDVSDDLGVSFRNTAQTFKSFVSAGMTADKAMEMVKFRADLEAVANTDKDLERLEEAFIQIEKAVATGRLEMDGFTSILAGLPGVTEESIFAKLGPMMGKTVAELKKMEKTKLPVPLLLKAIKAAFLEATGATELGALAIEKQLETTGGAFKAFKNIAGNALLRLGDELAPLLKDVLLPLFTDFIETLKSKEGAAAIKDIAKAIATLVKLGIAFGKGLAQGFKDMLPGIKGIGEAIGKLLGTGDQMTAWGNIFFALGRVIGVVAGAIAGFVATLLAVAAAVSAVVGAITALVTWFSELPSKLGELVSEFRSGGSSLGSAIIMGIIAGLTGGVSGVIATIVDLARKAIGASKNEFKIQSPSKVFEGIGGQVAAGMGQGLAAGAPMVSAAAAGMIDPSKMGSMGGTTNNINAPAKIGITIQDSGDPEATAAAVAATLEARLAGMFEAATLQVTVAGSA